MVEQDPHEVRQLVQSLEAATKRSRSESKKTFGCKKSSFAVAGSQNISVHSWRFMDWDYKRSDLPTYARGLFTTKLKDGRDEICIRGYDKFFNVDEVNETRWRNVETNTRGPYELSVKENGCIIFISGLEDGTLLVCSKHSTGKRADTPLSHAQAGEQWVERHLSKVGKTVKELALELRRMNVTAVGELCDDRFEEHVLAYDEDAAGIYLHGLNYNLPEFTTLPGSEVHRFADEWGFRKAEFVVMEDIKTVKDFLDKCAETGSWNGRDTEGFVIRCQLGNGKSDSYRDWFFKYKFEEPYLMYRQWREATKAVIAGKVPNIRKHKKITEEYLIYARRQLAKDPKIGRLYNQNHGIISMRQGFLDERGLKGSEIIAMENEGDLDSETPARNFVLVPVASIGCGKTTVALALANLFDWGHVQNDNLGQQKNKAQKFALLVTNSMAAQTAVIADRNNHQKRERKQLIDDVTKIVPDAKFIALHWVHEPKGLLLDDIRHVTRERVLTRGDNHQTIRAGSKDTGEIIGIMEGFLQRFEAVDTDREPDMYFHEVIDLDVGDSSRENLEKIVTRLHSVYPNLVKRVPDSAELDAALASALNEYRVDTDLSWGTSKKAEKKAEKASKKNEATISAVSAHNKAQDPMVSVKHIEYIGILVPPTDIQQLLTSIFNDTSGPAERNKLYHHLKNSRRIQPSFHVTLIHRALSKEQPQIWEQYTDLYISRMNERVSQGLPINPPTKLADARVRVERLVWNDEIMAFVVRILAPEGNNNNNNGQEKLPSSWPCVNAVPHITVGTANPNVKPKQSNDLLQKWLEVGSGGDTGIWEAEIPGVRVLDGSVLPVMMRGK